MGQFIEGIDRHQAMLLPECLDDYAPQSTTGTAIRLNLTISEIRAAKYPAKSKAQEKQRKLSQFPHSLSAYETLNIVAANDRIGFARV